MTTPMPLDYSDPAVIVASPNSRLRKQIVQDFMLSRISAAEAQGGADAPGKLESSECRLLLLDRKLPDLEASNLLLYQRAYQAAAEAINAVNQMLQTTINMGASS